MKSDDLKRQWVDASEYVGKYGKSEPHLKSVGKLHRVELDTEICHQSSPSAQNYWKDANFDFALSRVIEKRFLELAGEALALMKAAYEQEFVKEENAILERLAEIRAIKERA